MALPMIAAALGSAAISGIVGAKGARDRNKSQEKQAQKQMDFQEDMSSTAYQRATEDMRKAGLNPMLAYTQGGASSPSGSQANIENVTEPAISSAKAGLLLNQELKNMRATERSIDASAFNQRQAGWLAATNNELSKMSYKESVSRRKLNDANRLLVELQAPAARNAAAMEGTSVGTVAPYIDKILRAITGRGR